MKLVSSAAIAVTLAIATGCDFLDTWPEPASFWLEAHPEHKSTVAGRPAILLVQVKTQGGLVLPPPPVYLTAAADGAAVSVEPEFVWPGQIAEVWVTPNTGPDDPQHARQIDVMVRGRRGTVEQTVLGKVYVWSEVPAELEAEAVQIRELFATWLAENRDDLGVSPSGAWSDMLSPHVIGDIVGEAEFVSSDWHVHLFWLRGECVAPFSKWAFADLRRRFVEPAFSIAFGTLDACDNPPFIGEWQPDYPRPTGSEPGLQ